MIQHPASLFSIATGSTEPIYRQLMDQVRRMVASGQLSHADVMPSVRDIAQALTVNPMTVSKAYNLLELEGLLERKRGIGMLVAARQQEKNNLHSRTELLRPTLTRAALEARQLELDSDTVLAMFELILKETP